MVTSGIVPVLFCSLAWMLPLFEFRATVLEYMWYLPRIRHILFKVNTNWGTFNALSKLQY